MAKRHWLGKAAALDPHRDIAFPVPLHKGLRPLHFCRTICFKPLASWFSQLLRFLKTLHRSLFRKIQAMTIHIHREPSPPVLICRYLHTRFINCHGNLFLQMSKTKVILFHVNYLYFNHLHFKTPVPGLAFWLQTSHHATLCRNLFCMVFVAVDAVLFPKSLGSSSSFLTVWRK